MLRYEIVVGKWRMCIDFGLLLSLLQDKVFFHNHISSLLSTATYTGEFEKETLCQLTSFSRASA